MRLKTVQYGSLFAVTATAQSTLSLTLSASPSAATPASVPLNPSFLGMGIEPTNLFSFLGFSSPNTLSIQLFQNLADLMGKPPHLRIGGNTGDNMIYDSSVTIWNWQQNPSPTAQGNVPADLYFIGPTYFEAIDRLPAGTPITYGLNLAYEASDFATTIAAQAEAALSILKNVNVTSFEIGNEPDLYHQNGFRATTYDITGYAPEWIARAEAVCNNVLAPRGLNCSMFEAACTASSIGTTWGIAQLAATEITSSQGNQSSPFLTAWNEHDYFYFVGVSNVPLTLADILILPNTYSQFTHWTAEVQDALRTPYPYVLREMASAGPTGLQGISDTFGAALWTLNFFLYAASVNVSSVQMHMTQTSYASPWSPLSIRGQAPFVRPSYAAFAAMAALLGSEGGESIRVANGLPASSSIPASYATNVATWNIFADSHSTGAPSLSHVVIINSMPYNGTDTRGSLDVYLDLSALTTQTVYLSYLSGPASSSVSPNSNTTFNGVSYETSSGEPNIVDSTSYTAQVSSGGVTIAVQDSQAVVVSLGGALSRTGTGMATTSSSSSSSSGGSGGGKSAASRADGVSFRRMTWFVAAWVGVLVFMSFL